MKLSGALSDVTRPPSSNYAPNNLCDSPLPGREMHRQIEGAVTVIFFDFDGTLTATPGDRAAHSQKREELSERAPMLKRWLQDMRQAGATLGVITKSTENTVREALEYAGLLGFIDGPIQGRAVGFEGKVGFIDELARMGAIPRIGARGVGLSRPAVARRVLLVDDDVLELERARAWNMQTFAAPEEGGLRSQDLEYILGAINRPEPHRSSNKPIHVQLPYLAVSSSIPRLYAQLQAKSAAAGKQPVGEKWRTPILFQGECFERSG